MLTQSQLNAKEETQENTLKKVVYILSRTWVSGLNIDFSCILGCTKEIDCALFLSDVLMCY